MPPNSNPKIAALIVLVNAVFGALAAFNVWNAPAGVQQGLVALFVALATMSGLFGLHLQQKIWETKLLAKYRPPQP
jgi:uncharacterized membrane protein YkgB